MCGNATSVTNTASICRFPEGSFFPLSFSWRIYGRYLIFFFFFYQCKIFISPNEQQIEGIRIFPNQIELINSKPMTRVCPKLDHSAENTFKKKKKKKKKTKKKTEIHPIQNVCHNMVRFFWTQWRHIHMEYMDDIWFFFIFLFIYLFIFFFLLSM